MRTPCRAPHLCRCGSVVAAFRPRIRVRARAAANSLPWASPMARLMRARWKHGLSSTAATEAQYTSVRILVELPFPVDIVRHESENFPPAPFLHRHGFATEFRDVA